MAFRPKPHHDDDKHQDDKPAARAAAETTEAVPTEAPPTQIQELAAALLAAIRQPAYDDMPWPEIDASLQLCSHNVKAIIAQHGTLDPSPEDNVPQAASAG